MQSTKQNGSGLYVAGGHFPGNSAHYQRPNDVIGEPEPLDLIVRGNLGVRYHERDLSRMQAAELARCRIEGNSGRPPIEFQAIDEYLTYTNCGSPKSLKVDPSISAYTVVRSIYEEMVRDGYTT